MREKTNINNIPNINCLANHITNGWALSHTCVGETKGPPQYFCLFVLIWRRGGRGRAHRMGRVRGPSQRFLRTFWRTTSDLARGRGTQTDQPPPPRQAALIMTRKKSYYDQKNFSFCSESAITMTELVLTMAEGRTDYESRQFSSDDDRIQSWPWQGQPWL